MVKRALFMIWMFFLASHLHGAEVKVESTVEQGEARENEEVKGTITITHDEDQKVNESSFRVGNLPLQVQKRQDIKFDSSTPLLLSIYEFKMPPQMKGLHLLPSVSVEVGGKTYSSLQSSYEVKAPFSEPPPPANEAKGSLKLEAAASGAGDLYPGQKFKVVYRYLYNDNIELTKEILPLLEGAGFVKIGEKEVKESQQGAWSIQQISQELQAEKPGNYHFPPSVLEGYIWRKDLFGGRTYIKPALHAEAPAFDIVVHPFPKEGMPASFNGAVGPFADFSAHLKSASKITLGGKISLEIVVKGDKGIEKVPLPDLCCQPGFSGRFQLSDLPPVTEEKGNEKHMTVEMRPLASDIKEVPSIEFSFFLPSSKSYGKLKSAPIPLTIETPSPPSEEKKNQEGNEKNWKELPRETKPIEIARMHELNSPDLVDLPFGSWNSLWILPFGGIVLGGQVLLKRMLEERKNRIKPKNSEIILKEAFKASFRSPEFFRGLTRALLVRLVEKGHLKEPVESPEKLPKEGVAGEVRAFLEEVEQHRFTGQEDRLDPKLRDEVIRLFKRM